MQCVTGLTDVLCKWTDLVHPYCFPLVTVLCEIAKDCVLHSQNRYCAIVCSNQMASSDLPGTSMNTSSSAFLICEPLWCVLSQCTLNLGGCQMVFTNCYRATSVLYVTSMCAVSVTLLCDLSLPSMYLIYQFPSKPSSVRYSSLQSGIECFYDRVSGFW